MARIENAVDLLLSGRQQQTIIDNIPDDLYPDSIQEAYDIQDALVSALTQTHSSKSCGYKLACTSTPIMKLLGVDGPFSGRMMTHSTYDDGKVLVSDDFVHRVVELEFVIIMASDVPKTEENWTADSIHTFIASVIPGIEIVDHRYKDFTQVGGHALIADNAIHGASILGKAQADWHTIDLAQHPVSLIVNDKVVAQGSGENVLGSPLNVMAWLANHLQSRGGTLKSGEIITTGTACDVYYANSGDHVTADFGKLGTVSVSFS